MKVLKTTLPFALMFLGIGLLAGAFIVSPQLHDSEKPVLVENTK